MDKVFTFIGILIGLVIVGFILANYFNIVWKIFYRSLLGGAALIIINLICNPFNISIGVNIITCLTCEILGVPGFVCLMLMKYIL